jgi:hypothetical protein
MAVEVHRFVRRLKAHIFYRFTDGGDVVSLTRQQLSTPRKITGTNYLL